MAFASRSGALAASAFGFGRGRGPIVVDYLVVAGGGSGGSTTSGQGGSGGGAGGFLAGSNLVLPTDVTAITVGAGGILAVAGDGKQGGNSSIAALVVATGGGGGSKGSGGGGTTGGSGGGQTSGAGNAGIAGQGFAGGGGGGEPAGGGGASHAGFNTNIPTPGFAGAGGAGLSSSITGSAVTYAGGGGGSADGSITANPGLGGAGGGGNGGFNASGAAGAANTGGGGGGNWTAGNGLGGSGIVIVRYPSASQPVGARGGVITSAGGFTIHSFLASGNLDFSPIGATWDTTAGTPNVTFSNGNLTATKTTNNAFVSVRSTKYKLTGKWYAEKVAFSNGSTNNVGVGVGRGSFLLNLYAGQSAPSVGIRNNGFGDNDGVSWVSGAADLTIPDGTWTFIALDADTSRVWFKKQGGTNWNNSGTANPATGVGGLLLSGAGAIYLLGTLFGNTPGDTGTVNFGATAFIGTVPSGFTAWGS